MAGLMASAAQAGQSNTDFLQIDSSNDYDYNKEPQWYCANRNQLWWWVGGPHLRVTNEKLENDLLN